ncbi:MAG: chromosomal replication initiator DnaA [Holosporales bacterium]
MRQLAFELPAHMGLASEDFIEDVSNRSALSMVRRWPDWPCRGLIITGPAGSGKSHLASFWAARSGAQFWSPGMDEGQILQTPNPTLVLESPMQRMTEESLLHVMNAVTEMEGTFLITAEKAPTTWKVMLKDLRSRLLALPVFEIYEPSEQLLRQLMHKQFSDAQIRINPAVVDFLLTRIERSPAQAIHLCRKLLALSLEDKRSLSPANVRSWFQKLDAGLA